MFFKKYLFACIKVNVCEKNELFSLAILFTNHMDHI